MGILCYICKTRPPGFFDFRIDKYKAHITKDTHFTIALCSSNIYCLHLQVLFKYYPKIAMRTPSIGRKGKALRRRHQQRSAESQLHLKGNSSDIRQNFPPVVSAESETGIVIPFSVYLLSNTQKSVEAILLTSLVLTNGSFNVVSSMDMQSVAIFAYIISLSRLSCSYIFFLSL